VPQSGVDRAAGLNYLFGWLRTNLKRNPESMQRLLPVLFFVSLTLTACKVEKSATSARTARTAATAPVDTLVRPGTEPSANTAGVPATAPAAPKELAVGTPAGPLNVWIEEVERGVAGLPESAPKNAAAAQKRAMDLYLSRQEYIEMYWEEGGRLSTTPALSQAVKDAEQRFHELLAAVAPGEKVDAGKVRRAVNALKAQYDVVLSEARKGNVPLNPTAAFAGSTKAKNP